MKSLTSEQLFANDDSVKTAKVKIVNQEEKLNMNYVGNNSGALLSLHPVEEAHRAEEPVTGTEVARWPR